MALKSDANRFFLGYIWWILEPLLYVAVFYVVFNVILDSRRADFLVFLMCGKLPFVWFSKSVNQAANGIVQSAGLIGRIDIPKTLFPMAVIQQCTYKQLAVFALLLLFVMAYGYMPGINWFWLLPVVLVNYLMIVACALLGSVLVCYARDFSMIISLAMVFLMFTSGIFWDIRALPDPSMTDIVLNVNPLAFVLDAYRQILMENTPPDGLHLAQIGVLFSLLTAGTIYYMRRTSKQLALKALTA